MRQLVQPIEVGESGRPKVVTVLRNSAKCLSCGDEIESVHRHDFKFCSCEKVAVDGGKEYTRRVFSGEFEDTSEFEYDEMDNEEIQQHHKWGYF